VVEHADGLVDVHTSRNSAAATVTVLANPGDSVVVGAEGRSFRRQVHARGDRQDGALLFSLGRSHEIRIEIHRDGRPILLTTARAGDLVRAPDSH